MSSLMLSPSQTQLILYSHNGVSSFIKSLQLLSFLTIMASLFEVRATLAKVLSGTACNCGQALTDNALLRRTFQALHPHPEERLHLRMHRARSVILTSQE